jgi:hypothetical protein
MLLAFHFWITCLIIGESIPGTPKLTSTGQDRDIFLAHINYRCTDKKQNNKKQN